MKKILSFLQKKPLAFAAVALMSMTSYAQATAGADEATPKGEPQNIWAKVTDGSILGVKPYLKVTLVDEVQKKIYTVNKAGDAQVEAEDFVVGADAESNGSYLFACEGDPVTVGSQAFSLNTQADGLGNFINRDGKIEDRDLDPDVSWSKDISVAIWNEAWSDRYIYYDYNPENGRGEKIFKTTVALKDENEGLVLSKTPAVLYYLKEVYKPYIQPEEGVKINQADGLEVTIGNDNGEGKIQYKFDGDEEWTDYEGPFIIADKDKEITVIAKIVFDDGNETGEVSSTYLLTDIEAPEIEPETGFDVNDKGEIDDVTITSEDGTTLAYEITGEDGTTSRTEPSNEATENLIDYIGQTVTVTATANKTVTFKGKEEPVESDPTTREYIITPYPAPDEVEFMADPVPESTVDLGSKILLWFEVGQDEYGVEYDPIPEANKKLTLTFEDGSKEIVDVKTAEDGKVSITVPADKKYANSSFTFTVPEGFYYTYTGGEEVKANKVATDKVEDVKYYTGQFASTWVIDCDEESGKPIDPNKYLTTDDNTALFQVYPSEVGPDAEVDFADPESNDPTHGAKFTQEVNGEITPIESVEKVEGSKNMFKVTFYNPEGKAEYIEKYLKDDLLTQNGYHLGFPEKTFVSGDYTNGPNLSANIYFTEAVDLVVEPLKKNACEGGYYVYVKVTATGKVLGTDYNTAYDSDEDSKLVLDTEKEIAIVGTTIYGEEEEGTAWVEQLDPTRANDAALLKAQGIKEVYRIVYPGYRGREEEPELRDADRYLREDNGEPYVVTLPEGTFTINMSAVPEVSFDLDVTAHPYWAATARPYSYDEGKESASTITLDLTATLDDIEKLFEYDVTLFGEAKPEKITVSREGKNIPVKSWTLTDVSAPYTTTFEWKDSYAGVNAGTLTEQQIAKKIEAVKAKHTHLEGTEVPEESFVITITLDEPIDDVEVYDILIADEAFAANRCPNDEIRLKVYPKVNYFIETKYYSISTNTPSVEYYIAGILPDGSPLDKEIKYVGATEDQTTLNALAYNDALNENGTLKQEGSKYPEVTATELGTTDAPFTGLKQKDLPEEWQGKAIPATKFTLTFPEGTLVPNNYKMNFAGINPEGPAGTVQAEGYNANEWDLFNNFQVVPALFFDATSSYEDYQQPAKEDKEKEYNISTKTESITLYLTALNLYDNSNANKSIDLLENTELLIDGEEGVVTWEKDGEGYTVTFVDGGLAEGTYTLTVPAETVVNNTVWKEADPQIDVKNPEKFDLIINVEDFAGPDDQPIEITTKQFAFEVPIDGLTEVLVPTASFDDGTAATLSKVEDGVMLVTIGGAKPLVKGAEHNFLHSGDYVLTIPAGAFKGQYATSYEDIDVDVKVIFEFVDYGCEGLEDVPEDYKYRDLTTSTKEEVDAEAGEHEKIYFTRNFASTNLQALYVPFMIKPEEVSEDYFALYKIDFIKADASAPDDITKNTMNLVPVAEKSVALKPYVIEPNAELGLTTIALNKKTVYEASSSEVDCSTTTVKFTVWGVCPYGGELTTVDAWALTQGKIRKVSEVPAWRWFLTSEDRGVEYIKIAINGVDVEDADGIDFVEAAEGDAQIYNVAGQRLNAPAKGKVNIINGKKVFVK